MRALGYANCTNLVEYFADVPLIERPVRALPLHHFQVWILGMNRAWPVRNPVHDRHAPQRKHHRISSAGTGCSVACTGPAQPTCQRSGSGVGQMRIGLPAGVWPRWIWPWTRSGSVPEPERGAGA